uniref:Uncharacterized protein n=1 Tax=Anguilla anguilla TaxID=7936 RepID=A0A0E9S3J2_ANGAN
MLTMLTPQLHIPIIDSFAGLINPIFSLKMFLPS